MNNFERISTLIKKENIKNIALLSVDVKGKIHLLTLPSKMFSKEIVENGVGFDASSYGFAPTENSDMVLRPDLNNYFIDPFRETKTINFLTMVHHADKTRTRYEGDPRYIAEKAEKILKKHKIADYSLWGPEYEFFIFNDVEFSAEDGNSYIEIDSIEDSEFKSYHIAPPQDTYYWFRDEAVSIMESLGIEVKYHHHEVGIWGQQEIETKFETLLKAADNAIIIKYIIKNLAELNELKITFMPKPLKNQAGNGWHVHQFLMKGENNAFYKNGKYGNLNNTGLFYIGGILNHINSLIAITNPSTNSFKRLVPGFEAPTGINFGVGNRNSAVRIPGYVNNPLFTRIEFRTPDATSNPYLALSAMLMAGIDGIINKVNPIKKGYGPAEPKTRKKFKEIEANHFKVLENLKKDNGYLLRDDVFEKALIDKFIEEKYAEYVKLSLYPNPIEFNYYFDL
jgi:glutamine synthetase